MTILKGLMHEETVKRQTLAAKRQSEADEAAAIVAGLHAAIAPELPLLMNGLTFPIGYSRRMTVADWMAEDARGDAETAKRLREYRNPLKATGLCFPIRYQGAYAAAFVSRRKDEVPATIAVAIQSDTYGIRTEGSTVKVFDGFTPPAEVIAYLLSLIVPYAEPVPAKKGKK